MHIVGRQQPKSAVMVLGVVPREEVVAVGAGVLDGAEPPWEGGPVLQRLELRFGEWVVVGDVGAAMRLRDPQVGEQQRDGLRGHGRPAISVDGELVAGDALARSRLMNEPLG
jgi:hypothetical protein